MKQGTRQLRLNNKHEYSEKLLITTRREAFGGEHKV